MRPKRELNINFVLSEAGETLQHRVLNTR